jgi:hypothetical protein
MPLFLPLMTPLGALRMPPEKVVTFVTARADPPPPEICPLLVMPPANSVTDETRMACAIAEIVPVLTMPPKTRAAFATSMPFSFVAEIAPLLVMPPEKVEGVNKSPLEPRVPKNMPVPAVSLPLLVIPPAKLAFWNTSMATPNIFAVIVPLLLMPPTKLVT